MYGTLIVLGGILALGVLGWELVRRYRRYEKGHVSPVAWFAAFAALSSGWRHWPARWR